MKRKTSLLGPAAVAMALCVGGCSQKHSGNGIGSIDLGLESVSLPTRAKEAEKAAKASEQAAAEEDETISSCEGTLKREREKIQKERTQMVEYLLQRALAEEQMEKLKKASITDAHYLAKCAAANKKCMPKAIQRREQLFDQYNAPECIGMQESARMKCVEANAIKDGKIEQIVQSNREILECLSGVLGCIMVEKLKRRPINQNKKDDADEGVAL